MGVRVDVEVGVKVGEKVGVGDGVAVTVGVSVAAAILIQSVARPPANQPMITTKTIKSTMAIGNARGPSCLMTIAPLYPMACCVCQRLVSLLERQTYSTWFGMERQSTDACESNSTALF